MTELARLYDAATALVRATPVLQAFSPWPEAPPLSEREAVSVPAIAELRQFISSPDTTRSAEHQALIDATLAAADVIEWRRTYTESEVGADFMARYGFFELVGPTGHYHDDVTRGYVGYWGSGLHYPWHAHPAEEIYYVVAGSAEFEVEGSRTMRSVGESQLHASNQPHAMTTPTDGIGVFTFVLWRGDRLGESAVMTPSAA